MAASHIGVILHDFSTGGSERIAIRLCNAWAKMGRRVTIYCGTETGALRSLVAHSVDVTVCTPQTQRHALSRLFMGWRVARDIRAQGIDLIFAPGNYHIIVMAVLARLRFTKRPIFICKLSNPVRSAKPISRFDLGLEAVMRFVAAPLDAFTAMSPALKSQAEAVFHHHTIHYIDEPILDDVFMPIDQSRIAKSPATIICAGRLAPQKNFMLALDAFAKVAPRFDARLIILGEGPEHDQLIAKARQLGISTRVEFKGYVSDIRPFLAGARLFLMTSRFEGYPAVLIEALAAGVPIVTTDCTPAIREIVSSAACGKVTDVHDPLALSQAIEAILDAPPPDRALLIAATARHQMAASSAAYLDLFDTLCGGASFCSSQTI